MRREEIRTNAVILFVAALMYLALLSPVGVMKASGASMPVYRSANEGETALIIRLSWEAGSVESILALLARTGEEVTFAVNEQTASKAPSLISKISRSGHDIALLYSPSADLAEGCALIERITGAQPSAVVAEPDAARRIMPYALELNIPVIVPTVEFDAASMRRAEREGLAQSAIEGGFIAIDPSADASDELPFFIESIKNMGLDIVSIHKMLYN